MAVLLAMAAIGIDFTEAVTARHELYSATDSAASETARNCALHLTGCTLSDPSSSVTSFLPTGSATATVSPAVPNWTTDDSVTVSASRTVKTTLSSTVFDKSFVAGASSTYSWNYVATSGTPVVPFGIDWCMWNSLAPSTGNRGTQTTFGLGATLSAVSLASQSCTGAPGQVASTSTATLNGYVLFLFDSITHTCGYTASTGQAWDMTRISEAGFPDALNTPCAQNQIAALSIGQTVFIPIYTVTSTSGLSGTWSQLSDSGAQLTIVGFAPIYIDGFLSSSGTQLTSCSIGYSCRGVEGYFVRTTRAFDGWTYSHVDAAHNFGAVRITRTN